MQRPPLARISRYTRALFRDSFLLLREFWGPLVALISISLAVATIFYIFYPADTPSGRLPFDEALYLVVTLTVIEGAYQPPRENHWLIIFYFLMPFVGLLLASQGFANFLTLLFNRQARGQAWKVALASTLNRHIVVCGGGRVGSSVALQLAAGRVDVVLIEQTVLHETLQRLSNESIVVLEGDIRSYQLLEQAGIARADAVVICTDNDLANLEASIHCRELNPGIRIILRMYDGEVAAKVKRGRDIQSAYSSSALAAPVFAGAALNLDVRRTFYVEEAVMALGRFIVKAGAPLDGMTVGEIEATHELSLIMLTRDGGNYLHPALEEPLTPGTEILALAELPTLHKLARVVQANRRFPVVVCGGGRVGAKVAITLVEAGTEVVVIEQDITQPTTRRLFRRGISIVEGDIRLIEVLQEAGVAEAGAIVVCSDNDLANLETAMHCRDLNPDARIIMRMFDASLARKVTATFGIDAAYSSSALAAPVFAGAALAVDVQPAFMIGDEQFSIARLAIRPGVRLIGKSILAVEESFNVSVIMARAKGSKDLHPAPSDIIEEGMVLLVLGDIPTLRRLGDWQHPDSS